MIKITSHFSYDHIVVTESHVKKTNKQTKHEIHNLHGSIYIKFNASVRAVYKLTDFLTDSFLPSFM